MPSAEFTPTSPAKSKHESDDCGDASGPSGAATPRVDSGDDDSFADAPGHSGATTPRADSGDADSFVDAPGPSGTGAARICSETRLALVVQAYLVATVAIQFRSWIAMITMEAMIGLAWSGGQHPKLSAPTRLTATGRCGRQPACEAAGISQAVL